MKLYQIDNLIVFINWILNHIFRDPNKESPKEALVKLKKPQWPKFDANNPSVFKLAAKKQEQATASLFSEWQAKHDFWYKLLPNEIYNECKNNVNHYSSEKQPISAMNSSIVEKPFNFMIFLCLSLLLSLLFYWHLYWIIIIIKVFLLFYYLYISIFITVIFFTCKYF